MKETMRDDDNENSLPIKRFVLWIISFVSFLAYRCIGSLLGQQGSQPCFHLVRNIKVRQACVDGSVRVEKKESNIRGGCFNNDVGFINSCYLDYNFSNIRKNSISFRPVRNVKEKE